MRVLKCDRRQTTLSQAIQFALVKREIEGTTVYGL